MKQYIYVTKLKKQKLHVYFDKESSTFHYFKVQKDQLTETFPNELPIHIRYDAENNSFEISENRKQHQKALDVLKSVVATLGVAVTITAAYPKVLSVVDYAAIKKETLFTTAKLVSSKTSDEEYYELFRNQIEKNSYFTDEEKKIVAEGHVNFLKDWGYLLDEAQKEFILYQAENMTIVEDSSIAKENLSGRYHDSQITIYDRDDIDVILHESDHGFSDHGSSVGTMLDYISKLGIKLNEAIGECVSAKYKEKNDSQYTTDQQIVFILSQIVGKEVLVKNYASRDTKIDKVIKAICDNCPNINVFEAINFFAKWDKLQLDSEKLSEEERKQLENYVLDLVLKFYKDKYGFEFSETIFYTTWQNDINHFNSGTVINFLDDKFHIIESDDTTCVYSIPMELGNQKIKSGDYKDYLTYAKSNIPLANGLATLDELYEYRYLGNELLEGLEEKYRNNSKFESLKQFLKNRTYPGTEEATLAFADLSFENVMASYNDPKYIACRLKELTDYTDFIFKSTYINRISELLRINNCKDVLYYYENTNIFWKGNSKTKVLVPPVPSNFYDEYELCKDYIITNNGTQDILLVRVPVGKEPVHYHSTSLYKAVRWYKVSEEQLSYFSAAFKPGEGEYYCTVIDDDFDFSGTIKIKDADDIPEETYTFTK